MKLRCKLRKGSRRRSPALTVPQSHLEKAWREGIATRSPSRTQKTAFPARYAKFPACQANNPDGTNVAAASGPRILSQDLAQDVGKGAYPKASVEFAGGAVGSVLENHRDYASTAVG